MHGIRCNLQTVNRCVAHGWCLKADPMKPAPPATSELALSRNYLFGRANDTVSSAMKIANLGIKRDKNMMYFIKGGDVWATPRKQPGKPKGKPQKIAATGIDLDYSKYLYY